VKRQAATAAQAAEMNAYERILTREFFPWVGSARPWGLRSRMCRDRQIVASASLLPQRSVGLSSHVFGLFARDPRPLAIMPSADQVPITSMYAGPRLKQYFENVIEITWIKWLVIDSVFVRVSCELPVRQEQMFCCNPSV
jgi:hypothetical protein